MKKTIFSLICILHSAFCPAQTLPYRTFAVIGDSYSTFVGQTDPVDNAQYYPVMGLDVYQPSMTWWGLFEKETGIRLVHNNSYSGGTICNTWWNGADASAVSFVKRVQDLREADLYIVEGATNDNNAGSPLGTFVYENWTTQQIKQFRPATAWVLNYLKETHPNATIVFMLNSDLRADINSSVETICQHYDVPLLKLAGIEKGMEHPTYTGMKAIRAQLIQLLLEREGYVFLSSDNTVNTARSDADADVCFRSRIDRGWGTFCLPFGMNEEQIHELFGPDAQVARLTGVEENRLLFTTVSETEALYPYLVRVSEDFFYGHVSGVTFCGSYRPQYDRFGDARFTGTLTRASLASSRYYIIDADLEVRKPASGSFAPAYSGYLNIAPAIVNPVIYLDGEQADIPLVPMESAEKGSRLYTIGGIPVDDSQARNGIFIRQGKKIMVK